jgi:ATP-dependent DNA ligase
MVEAGEDFVPRVEEFRPEGVVAKPFSSTYIPGRRRSAW